MEDFKKEILRANNKPQWLSCAKDCATEPKKFTFLLECFKSEDIRLQQNAANILNHFFELFPQKLKGHIVALIDMLDREQIHGGVKRNIVRWLQMVDLADFSEDVLGKVLDHCFGFVNDRGEAIAVRAFSITVLANACKLYPELKNELKPILEALRDYGSAGEKSRAKRILGAMFK